MTGEQGLGFITHGRAGPQRVGALVDVYRDAIKIANPVGKFIHDRIAVDTLVFCDVRTASAPGNPGLKPPPSTNARTIPALAGSGRAFPKTPCPRNTSTTTNATSAAQPNRAK